MEIKGDNSSDDPGDNPEITMDRDEQEMDVDPEQPCPLRSAGLKWEDFFGSSVDLAPTLMTIYDNYASGNAISAEECNYNDVPTGTAGPQTPTKSSIHSVNQNHVTASSLKPSTAVTMEMRASDGGGESDGPPSALSSYAMNSGSNDVSKKRPLSVSSTSSSTSSTSSLPRQQRKKLAGMPLSPTSIPACPALIGNGAVTIATNATPNSCTNSQYPTVIVSHVTMLDTLTDDENEDYTKSMARSPSVSPCHRPLVRQDSTSSGGVSYIDKVVGEILATERAYVHDLSEIIEGYLHELRDAAEPKMDPVDIDALFGNIEEIHEFNRVFLGELEACQQDAVLLAKCFVDKNEGFVIYTDYCTNYPRAVEILTDVMRNPVTAEVFKQQQVALSHNLPLGAYLLKPVQRILKYHLLLENILSHMDRSLDGVDVIETALSSMTNMAQHINEMKRKHEHTVRIQEIQSQLDEWDGEDLTTYGDLILEDTFRMHGAKGYRHLLLFEKGLLIAKRRDDSSLLIKGAIMCSNLMLIESIPGEPLSFHVIPFDNPRHQYTVQAKNLEQKRQWCLELKHLILENYNAVIPDKAKELVMTLGKSRDEQKLEHEGHTHEAPSSGRKQHTAPQYLEKRRTRRKSATLLDFGLLKAQKAKKAIRKEDLGSPKLSPRVQRRRSESAVPQEKMRHLIDTHNKREREEVNNVSDTDSTGQGLSHSMESLNSPSADTPTGSLPRQDDLCESDTETETNCNNSTVEDGSGQVSTPGIRLLPRLDWPNGSMDDDEDNFFGSPARVNSPLKRTESFRIATLLNRVDSEKRPGRRATGKRTSEGAGHPRRLVISESCAEMDNRCRVPQNIPRRVSDGDFSLHQNASRSLLQKEGLKAKKATAVVSNTVAGNGNAPVHHINASTQNQNKQVPLAEGEDSDSTELPQHQSHSSLVHNDTNNNHGMQGSPVIGSPRARSSEHLDNRKAVDQGCRHIENVLSNGPKLGANKNCGRPASAGGSRRFIQKLSPHSCNQPDRSPIATSLLKRQQGVARSNSLNASDRSSGVCVKDSCVQDATGLYDNVHYKAVVKPDTDPRHKHMESYKRSLSSSALLHSAAFVQSYLNSNISTGASCDNDPRVPAQDPWILRSDSPVQRNLDHPHNPRGLWRSSSFSSLSESREDILERRRKGHKRLPSDTLIFTNRTAYLTSESPCMIRHDVATERIIARLATPPRELGPEDLILQVKESQERGRVVTRYATPPRSFSELPTDSTVILNSCSSGPESTAASDLTDDQGSRPSSPSSSMNARSHSTLPADMRHPEDSPFWCDFEEYIQKSPNPSPPLPKFPLMGSGASEGGHISPPDGFRGSTCSGAASPTSTLQSPTLSSPSSMMSTDSLVESLRQAVCSITSKLTKRNSRSIESSPSRTPRTRSISALEELRVDHLTEQEKNSDKRKEKRSKFVYQLARAYSDRIKKRTRSVSVERKPLYCQREKESVAFTKQIAALLRDSKQGSSVIGERMAATNPIVLGTYTLPRHRPARPKQELSEDKSKTTNTNELNVDQTSNESCEASQVELVVHLRNQEQLCDTDSTRTAHDSGCLDIGVKDLNIDEGEESGLPCDSMVQNGLTNLQATSPGSQHTSLGVSGSDDDDSSIYYYERRFVEDLESNFGDDIFRDSAVYSDDGNGAEIEPPGPKVSIKQAVKLIELRTKSKPLLRTEVRRKEKAQSIKEILRSLEGSSATDIVQSANKTESEIAAAAAAAAAASEKLLLKSIRDRTRELVECATLTRIRQTACQISDEGHRVPLGGAEGAEGGAAAAGESSPPLRRGWVKEVVDKLQHEQE